MGGRLYLYLKGRGLVVRCDAVGPILAARSVPVNARQYESAMDDRALTMAVWRRGRPNVPIQHSGHGSQYTSDQFQRLLCEMGVI